MQRFEGKPDTISRPHKPLSERIVSRSNDDNFFGNPEKIKDYLFDQYMKQQLIEDFFEDLSGYLSKRDIDVMQGVLAEYDDEEVYAALSLPRELRERNFERLEKELENDTPREKVFHDYIERNARYGFGIGYHTSPFDLRPDDVSEGQWTIKGTEADHRDDDRMMAYYSTQYRHLFKKKHPQFIYIVRTDPSTHKTDGNWSRSDSLSVIMRVPFKEVVDYVEGTYRETNTATD